ncbi:probable plastid-lipid-associated protein 4, chloroplastic [Ricinus communis]|uniref:Structural molecule, putative n=1 Tax=Ricinus communis TaxID=3988 RepID=B9SRI7_RICCO|nr:probable plastid-lipid-associated protein 4, chloroplastic [Ricinus communis]EEF33764.1 structural molecule, putative [Ricinus communis]|eukprot:XP_002528606.1 probable plastid-lipid-associated protein 4, chloroplastic [Ricinus communis]
MTEEELTITMALSSSSSPAILTASHFSTNPPNPKLTTTTFYFSSRFITANYSKTSFLNLNSSNNDNNSTFDDKWRAKVSFFPAFLRKKKDANVLKEELLDAIASLDRGAEATPEDQQRVDEIARQLEAVNPTKQPLKSDLINGKWELIYTTSQSILQTQRPKFLRSKTNYQAINVDTLRAQNMESWPFFNQVTADLTPLNAKKVAVKFDTFKIASLIPVKAPGSARGELETTYLDEELRISRGDKGNLFVLKMIDPSYRVPA